VYFQRKDYAGFWLRLLADLIDVVVAGAVCSALVMTTIAIWAVSPSKISMDLMLAKLHSSSFLLLCNSQTIEGRHRGLLRRWS